MVDEPIGSQSLLAPEPAPATVRPTKTPFFEAVHASRYQRQSLIREIQCLTGRRLICYVSGRDASIHREDTVGFMDLLHNVQPGSDVDLLLHTGGGDIDAAEKLISMVRRKVRNAKLRVVVPDYAKSAGTLMALGADAIVMSDSSELGPIDPQIVLTDGNGNKVQESVQNYLDAYENHSKTLVENPNNMTAQIMLKRLDPTMVELFKSIVTRARHLAEDHLKMGMFRESGNWSAAVTALLDVHRWQSHGQMISWEDAQSTSIGLTVEYLDPQDTVWQKYWHLHCLQRLSIADSQKLFESDYVSLPIDGTH
jgi:ATP-dependent protease ClpP protease subunit